MSRAAATSAGIATSRSPPWRKPSAHNCAATQKSLRRPDALRRTPRAPDPARRLDRRVPHLRRTGPHPATHPAELHLTKHYYEAAILQPSETEAAGRLKEQRPDMTVLAYKCLSSVRDFEQGRSSPPASASRRRRRAVKSGSPTARTAAASSGRPTGG